MDSDRARWAQATYASFQSLRFGGGGGWRLGKYRGIDDQEAEWVRQHAPTRLDPVQKFDDFIASDEIDRLPRRFAYFPQGVGTTDVYMQSVPAGKDATGRPGNVFTHVFFNRSPDEPKSVSYPIELYDSEDFLTPFRAPAVNSVELPEVGEPAGCPLDPSITWVMVNGLQGDRMGALFALQQAVEIGPVVLVTNNVDEAVNWIQALSITMSPVEARKVGFCTFERAETLTLTPQSIACVPRDDLNELRVRCPVVDIENPKTYAEPITEWNRLTAAVLSSDKVEEVAEKQRHYSKDSATFGAGLAAIVLEQPSLFDAQTVDVAAKLLPAAQPAPQPDQQQLAAARGSDFYRWLENGVTQGYLTEDELHSGVFHNKIVDNDDLFEWLKTPADIGNRVVASAILAAWEERFRPDGPWGSEWLGHPGACIHPETADQLGFATSSSVPARISEIAARIQTSGLQAVHPAECGYFLSEMTQLQRNHNYFVPRSGDELTGLWHLVEREQLIDTGYQQWYEEHQQAHQLLEQIHTGVDLGSVLAALNNPETQKRIAFPMRDLMTSYEFRDALLRMATVILAVSDVFDIFQGRHQEKAKVHETVHGGLLRGVDWERICPTDNELKGLVDSVIWPDYRDMHLDISMKRRAINAAGRLSEQYRSSVAQQPRIGETLDKVAGLLAARQGELR